MAKIALAYKVTEDAHLAKLGRLLTIEWEASPIAANHTSTAELITIPISTVMCLDTVSSATSYRSVYSPDDATLGPKPNSDLMRSITSCSDSKQRAISTCDVSKVRRISRD
jgi:hypothetical protein